ncbi:MAG: hypothetical protein M3P51_16410, partial [Chloroflexota bacterium]|nr:hypothetical protein [Chloroflexota bacterium]
SGHVCSSERRLDGTSSKTTGREITLRQRGQHEAPQVARQRQWTDEFWEQYAMRAWRARCRERLERSSGSASKPRHVKTRAGCLTA